MEDVIKYIRGLTSYSEFSAKIGISDPRILSGSEKIELVAIIKQIERSLVPEEFNFENAANAVQSISEFLHKCTVKEHGNHTSEEQQEFYLEPTKSAFLRLSILALTARDFVLLAYVASGPLNFFLKDFVQNMKDSARSHDLPPEIDLDDEMSVSAYLY